MNLESENLAPIKSELRLEHPVSVFYKWFAGSISIGVFPLIFMLSSEYTTAQLILIFIVSTFFFVIVGIDSIPGFTLGLPTMAYSRVLFFTKVSRLISGGFWISNLGWQIVNLATLFYILLSLIDMLNIESHLINIIISIVIGTLLTYLVPLIGHTALSIAQKLFSFLILIFTFILFITNYSVSSLQINAMHHVHINSTYSVLAGLSLVLVAGSLSWAAASSDYTRFVKPSFSGRSIFLSTFLGGGLGNALLLLTGYFYYLHGGVSITQTGIHSTGTNGNVTLYLCTASIFILCLSSNNFLNSYSSTFQASVALGREVKKYILLTVDGALSISVATLILIDGHVFISYLINFISLVELIVAPWAGVYTINALLYIMRKYSDKIPRIVVKINSAVFMFDVVCTAEFSNNYLWHGKLMFITDNYNIAPMVGFLLPFFIIPFLHLIVYSYNTYYIKSVNELS